MSIRSLPITISTTTLPPQATVMEALQAMLANRINHVPVCDGERYIGLISVNDILQKLLPAGVQMPHGVPDLKFAGDASRLLGSHFRHLSDQTAQQILHSTQLLDEDCPLLEAALLLSKSPTPLPVVDASGKLLGMLSRRGLLEYLSNGHGKGATPDDDTRHDRFPHPSPPPLAGEGDEGSLREFHDKVAGK